VQHQSQAIGSFRLAFPCIDGEERALEP